MMKVIRPRLAVYQYVIKKHKYKTTKEGPEHIIHESLERRRSVAQPERHDQKLVEAFVGAERRLVYVLRPHAHLVVPRTQVQLGEETGAMEFVQQLVDHRDRKGVLHRERVQCAVVNAEDDRRGEHGLAVTDNALLHHGGTLPLKFVLVGCWIPVRAHCHWRGAWLEDDVVVAAPCWWQPRRLGEDVGEVVEEPVQERSLCRGGVDSRRGWCSHPCLADRASLQLERHGAGREISHDRTQSGQPMRAKDHIVPRKGHDEEVDAERQVVDCDLGLAKNARAGNALVVGHRGC